MERPEYNQIRIDQLPKNPWGKVSWESVYGNRDIQDLQKEFRLLSEHINKRVTDQIDIASMRFLFDTWREPVDEQILVDYVMTLKESKRTWIGKQLVYEHRLWTENF